LMQANISQEGFDAIFHPTVDVSLVSFNQQAVTDNGILSYTLKSVGSAPAEKFNVHVEATVGSKTADISPRNFPSDLALVQLLQMLQR
jgi:hypothetical protein